MADALSDGHLEAARAAGAHDQYIAFVADHPESRYADSLTTAISMDALDHPSGWFGSLEYGLWEHGVSHCSNADPETAAMLRETFGEDALPEVLRDRGGDE